METKKLKYVDEMRSLFAVHRRMDLAKLSTLMKDLPKPDELIEARDYLIGKKLIQYASDSRDHRKYAHPFQPLEARF